MASKYDAYWPRYLERIRWALNGLAEGEEWRLPCQDIRRFGKRGSWQGSVTIGEGRIISGGGMVHMKSLGNMLARATTMPLGRSYRLSMDKDCVLTMTCRNETIAGKLAEGVDGE
jgi:hypothetical protein